MAEDKQKIDIEANGLVPQAVEKALKTLLRSEDRTVRLCGAYVLYSIISKSTAILFRQFNVSPEEGAKEVMFAFVDQNRASLIEAPTGQLAVRAIMIAFLEISSLSRFYQAGGEHND